IRFALKGPKINLPEIIGRITSDRTHETKRVKIPLCIGPITFEQEGEYSFETYVDDKELPIYIKKFRISLKPAPH
ncbi:MAG: hypothetical protein ACXW52_23695, partial [Candidatus Binatia bacterium]